MTPPSSSSPAPRKPTRTVQVGTVVIGGGNPIVVQSMCATKTTDIEATVAQINRLVEAGAGIVRVAVDSSRDCRALAEIRAGTNANLAVDLQENYRLVKDVAPLVEKIRYNPGHLHHLEPDRPWQDKVRFLAEVAAEYDCALRVGVNCGSLDPALSEQYPDPLEAMVICALEQCEVLDRLGFVRYCVSLKDSRPENVIAANRRFAAERPDVPLHLGLTEAGLPPEGILKTRAALGPLLSEGIGDTIRFSLTLPSDRKHVEVSAARELLADLAAGRPLCPASETAPGLNIISCPSCSRVENAAFVELAEKVRQATRHAASYPITIAVMGCRVNGPGESDHADLGLWCGADVVHLKRGPCSLGTFSYEEIIPRLLAALDALVKERFTG